MTGVSFQRIGLALLIIGLLAGGIKYASDINWHDPEDYVSLSIAHAGGSYKKMTYTNSVKALNSNYARGFRQFEIDMNWTADNALVCIHHWDWRAVGLTKETFPGELPTLAEFEEWVAAQETIQPCTLDTLITWLRDHPDAEIVTDVKSDNIAALTIIASKAPDLVDRFIPQIYQPNEYEPAKALGFSKIIWTLYRSGLRNDPKQVIEAANTMDLLYLTIPPDKAKNSDYTRTLNTKITVPIFTHGMGGCEVMKQLSQSGIDGFYIHHDAPGECQWELHE